MMQYQSEALDGVRVEISRFRGSSGVEEVHLMLSVSAVGAFVSELPRVEAAYRASLSRLGLPATSAIFRRVFLSDAANQTAILEGWTLVRSQDEAQVEEGPVAVSIVEQPPLPQQRLALWAYHVHDPAGLRKRAVEGGVVMDRGENRHLWLAGLRTAEAEQMGSRRETTRILEDYVARLRAEGADLAHHAVRTWFFVQNVDLNYQGMVRGRTEVFERHGLTAATHYLASTGIEGRSADARRLVQLDAFAVAGLRDNQIRFLQAPQHLGPTNVYGVTFERGTQVSYRDRSHAIISGTASIEPRGRSLHVGDVVLQAQRACENVEALLADAQFGIADLAQMIVYVRDGADWPRVQGFFGERYPAVPCVAVRAPVCRPEWLLEIECLAIREHAAAGLPQF